MDKPLPAVWPADFPKSARLRILADQRAEYNRLEWARDIDGGVYIETTAFTPYGETLTIVRDETMKLYPTYQVNGDAEDPILHEVEFPPHNTWVRAQQTLSDYVIDLWGSYAAWEERTLMEMAQDPEDM